MLRVYTLSHCDTCRRAVKWLRLHGVELEEKAIRETPPTAAELRAALAALGGNRMQLFNTAGADYRAQKLGEKLPALSDTAAIALLAGNGSLVKRPLVIGQGVALAGFNEAAWAAALLQK
ncbi:MAG TPA: Spx/MgsR family RNA polymerase-binding regulatory protein [Opitutaceae bacterium]|nr:Spx/MgsR family RNA polymerase-binding regulatory protein [Opitutaceae bacterium]